MALKSSQAKFEIASIKAIKNDLSILTKISSPGKHDGKYEAFKNKYIDDVGEALIEAFQPSRFSLKNLTPHLQEIVGGSDILVERLRPLAKFLPVDFVEYVKGLPPAESLLLFSTLPKEFTHSQTQVATDYLSQLSTQEKSWLLLMAVILEQEPLVNFMKAHLPKAVTQVNSQIKTLMFLSRNMTMARQLLQVNDMPINLTKALTYAAHAMNMDGFIYLAENYPGSNKLISSQMSTYKSAADLHRNDHQSNELYEAFNDMLIGFHNGVQVGGKHSSENVVKTEYRMGL